MRKRKIIFCLLVFILVSNNLSAETKWLVKERSFRIGEDEEGYKALTDLAITKQGFIFLENVPGHRILAYSKDGNLFKAIGKLGKKPEEFDAPIELSLWRDEILVKDNGGFSIFKTDGSFVRRFNPFVNIQSVVYINDKIFILTATPDKKSLIDVFTPEGKFISEFGEEFLKLDYSKFKHMSHIHAKGYAYAGKLLSDGEHLYYLNSAFGKVLVFSLEGILVKEYDITQIFGDEGQQVVLANKKLWLEEGIDLKETEGRIPTREMFRDAFLCRDRIYLLTRRTIPLDKGYTQDNEVRVLNKKEFKLIDLLKVRKSVDEGVLALAVTEINKEPIFHFTMWVRGKTSIYAEYWREK